MNKDKNAYKNIGEVAKEIGLINKKTGALSTHTIRFWQKEFKQIQPKILAGNRRYYDQNAVKIIKKIQYLLKDRGMTLKDVKALLSNEKSIYLDEINYTNINTSSINKKKILSKIKKITNIIKDIKDFKNG